MGLIIVGLIVYCLIGCLAVMKNDYFRFYRECGYKFDWTMFGKNKAYTVELAELLFLWPLHLIVYTAWYFIKKEWK